MLQLKEWQDILNLQDWEIALRRDCTPDDMTSPDQTGEVEFTESTKTALIRILDPKYAEDHVFPYNPEKTLIHELLHLKFALIESPRNQTHNRVLHQIISDLASAFTQVKENHQTPTVIEIILGGPDEQE